jgi:elongator complex protein 1
LKHLHALEAFEEVKQYVVRHSLYREALELYKYQAEQLREMTRLYADYLYEQSNYQEAAIGKTQ